MVDRYKVEFTAPHPVNADAVAIHIHIHDTALPSHRAPAPNRFGTGAGPGPAPGPLGAPPSTFHLRRDYDTAHKPQGAAQVPSTSVRDSHVPNPIDGDPRSAPTVHIDARTHPISGTDG